MNTDLSDGTHFLHGSSAQLCMIRARMYTAGARPAGCGSKKSCVWNVIRLDSKSSLCCAPQIAPARVTVSARSCTTKRRCGCASAMWTETEPIPPPTSTTRELGARSDHGKTGRGKSELGHQMTRGGGRRRGNAPWASAMLPLPSAARATDMARETCLKRIAFSGRSKKAYIESSVWYARLKGVAYLLSGLGDRRNSER